MTNALNILWNSGIQSINDLGHGIINTLHYIFPNFG